MSKQPVIAISQRTNYYHQIDEYRDEIDQKLMKWVLRLGFLPLQIPNILEDKLYEWIKVFSPHGFIFSGGEDVGSNNSRDSTEKEALKFAMQNNLPVLGICRGMQIMGLEDSGELCNVADHVNVSHSIKGIDVERGKLPMVVNSYHKLAFKKCPKSYQVIATSDDNVIEAFSHKKLPWEAWMWHPERDGAFEEILLQRATSLFLLRENF